MFIFAIFLSALQAQASTSAVFSTDRAVIMVRGQAADADATNLFNGMKASAVDEGDNMRKSFNIRSSTGAPLIDLVCSLSKSTVNYGACTLTISKSRFAHIDTANRRVVFAAGAADGASIMGYFVNPDASGKIVLSQDQRLGVYVDNAGQSTQAFRIFFKD
ncbi:MAG TPA: hypothetical protein VIH99_03330 [Bdellovibrionota bacterium]|jgi:hypothetical protein